MQLLPIFLLLNVALGDVYMHSPRGSNDRNCERNVNRNNGNRLFDSQNNAKGGYACPRAVGGPSVDNNDRNNAPSKMKFYGGSKLVVEWTNQHGCGAGQDKTHCELVLQYACEEQLDAAKKYRSGTYIGTPRDGIPRDQNDAATDTIPTDEASGKANTVETRRFGMHETPEYYAKCKSRQRNRGLFTADQKLRRKDATATRQNPNGNRNGLECPEERDYYPYWHPTPWVDIAVLVSDPSRCEYYEKNSENYVARGECVPAAGQDRGKEWPNNRVACMEKGGTWTESTTNPLLLDGAGKHKVECLAAEFSRPNHLGNSDQTVSASVAENRKNTGSDIVGDPEGKSDHAQANRYIWTLPDGVSSQSCVLRLRYNISTFDYDPWAPSEFFAGSPEALNASHNGKASPIKQDPYVDVGALGNGEGLPEKFLSLALNTNQYGRTFQDRSYAFALEPRPATAPADATIYNLNVRGKRGNIVQTYPAVEYDFVPNNLQVKQNDLVHFQWTGSDYNPRRGCNDAEGGPPDPPDSVDAAKKNSRADRSNIVEMDLTGENFPQEMVGLGDQLSDINAQKAYLKGKTYLTDRNGDADMAAIRSLAFLDQQTCLTREELDAIKNKNQRENHPLNCAKLNNKKSPHFNMAPFQMRKVGTMQYYSTRNNNFSNRDQTGRICVGTDCSTSMAEARAGSPLTKTALSRQLASDVNEVTEGDILQGDTFAVQPKDNDALGDGDQEGCEAMFYDFLRGVGPGGLAGLAVGFACLGSLLTVLALYGARRLRERRAGGGDAEKAWLQEPSGKSQQLATH